METKKNAGDRFLGESGGVVLEMKDPLIHNHAIHETSVNRNSENNEENLEFLENTDNDTNDINEDSYSENEAEIYYDNEEEDYTGCISVRDFAYDNESPLHYGYLEEAEEVYSVTDDDDYDSVEYTEKRKSYTLPREYIINKQAIALYDFENLNDNELPLKKGDLIFIKYKHGQGWLVVQRLDDSGEAGLVPEDYVEILEEEDEVENDNIILEELNELNLQEQNEHGNA